jgi:hypothetical protein
VVVTLRRVPDDIYQGAYRLDKDLLIERNAKRYVDCAIFERFIRHHLIPHITRLRTIPCDSKADALLLMDNCSSHVTPEIFKPLGENHIEIFVCPPHTTNIFQALDLSFFGVLKAEEKFWTDHDDDKTLPARIFTLVL